MSHASTAQDPDARPIAATGIQGLDAVLHGGLTARQLYLIEGIPGSGKTTLGLQFILEGARRGEPALYVTLSETAAELRTVAASHGWDLSGVEILEVIPPAESLEAESQYTIFHPSELELSQTTQLILAEVERVQPRRLVFDSLTEMRLLAGTALRYRRQILALKQYFAGRGCTVMLLDDLSSTMGDVHVQSIAHGVILLEQQNPEYGAERRRLRVQKLRGMAFRGGFHDYVIRRGGMEAFPRLVAAEHRHGLEGGQLSSGIDELDRMLDGGIDRGCSTLIVGSPGTGKSTLALQFVAAAADRGQSAALFIFDESPATLLRRTRALGMDLDTHLEAGRVTIQQVDPAELSPGQLAHAIQLAVEEQGAAVIVIDSLNGYLNAMPGERHLVLQLHELLSYLGQRNVATLLIGAQRDMLGHQLISPVDATYLADTVLLLRYFETRGEVRQAISVIKKRGGTHERTIRELRLLGGRIQVGPPLREFRGILTGVPDMEDLAS